MTLWAIFNTTILKLKRLIFCATIRSVAMKMNNVMPMQEVEVYGMLREICIM